jgi:hypothetical protein
MVATAAVAHHARVNYGWEWWIMGEATTFKLKIARI